MVLLSTIKLNKIVMADLIELNFINYLAEIRRRQEEEQRKRKPTFIKSNEIVDGIEDVKFFKIFLMKKLYEFLFKKYIFMKLISLESFE